MRRWRGWIFRGLALTLFLGLFGCGDLYSYRMRQEREPEKQPALATSYRFDDIPLPPGMTLSRKESFVYETRATRTGLLVYEGKGEMERLANFFKEQMPNYQWRMVSNFEFHNVMLTFIKEGWSSIIYIQPQPDETKRIEIRVGPIDLKFLPAAK
ncbi:MAG: hypothetical protein N3G78_00840 [Desulfobacterota bacterium]|nr:hypothetical protein [Thermodesulfobacteriota bacterium]